MRGCPRCQGLLVSERIRGDTPTLLTLLRCVSCGFYTDPVMEMNRAMPLGFDKASTEPFPASDANHHSSESVMAEPVEVGGPTPSEARSIA